jgi:hypothetical protein
MKRLGKLGLLPLLLPLVLLTMMILPILSFAAQPAKVDLGSTVSFAVLAGSAITNTGPTVISGGLPEGGGNIGVHPSSSITGLADITMTGWIAHTADAEAAQAKADLQLAYDDAAGRPSDADLTGQDLGDLTLTSGVYSYSTSAQLTGTLTLDAEGDPDAVFIFQIGSALTTASYSNVLLLNGARFCRVFWQVGSSATLGTYSDFAGHIFAQESITATTSATIQGQLLALTSAVTLDSNIITNELCAEAETTTDAPTTDAPTTDAPTTDAPTTDAPTTDAPTTDAPTTDAPTTDAPTTDAPTTDAPTTDAPTTDAPTTDAPTTDAPTTDAPTTDAPTTDAPTMGETTTQVGTTTAVEATTQAAITTAAESSDETAVTTAESTSSLTTTQTETQATTPVPATGNSVVRLVVLAMTNLLIFMGIAYAARKKPSLI